ncbi:MAG: hypothetical protein NC121_06125 [Blautia sp.]|nr:hypothetical protein [Blautia sp.]
MGEYLKIVFQNLEPVRIADDSSSQSGQTVTLRYIPGTALRGVVMNALAREADFETMKKSLLSTRVRYLNAYLTDGEKELIPSPKGFYEDKTEQRGKKEIDNVVIRGEFEEGKKRASLGRFCRMEGDCIYYYNVDTGSDLKITINEEKRNVFRSEHICAGYTFTGYIALEDDSLRERIRDVFAGDFTVGNARTAGLGKCRVIRCEYTDRLPFEEYLPAEDLENECYMMLLSNTVMRDEKGELCGLDCAALAEKMDVTGLEAAFCATSTVDVRGFNNTWRTRTPSAVMYEQGSVFHLKYNGTFTRERMLALCHRGIGIRLNEGLGRVMFLGGYEKIRYKEAALPVERMVPAAEEGYAEDGETLQIAAGCYYRNLLDRKINAYVVEHPFPKGKIANSQLDILESFAAAYQYESREAVRYIDGYLSHALDKEENSNIQKARNSIGELKKYIHRVFDTDLETLLSVSTKRKESVMGVPKSRLLTEEEELKYKLELLIRMIRYDKKTAGTETGGA